MVVKDINKKEFADRIASKMGIYKYKAMDMLDAFPEVLEEAVLKGESIYLKDFVTFDIVDAKQRDYVNPQNQKPVKGYPKKKSKLNSVADYKAIDPRRLLDISHLPVVPLGTDEIFVKLMDYKDTWLSNYGRIIKRTYGNYSLLNGTFYKSAGLRYTLPKNVFIDGRWVFRPTYVYAAQLVIETFIVNNDKLNNTFIWHSGNNKEDNYYRNLYPLTEKQYYTVREHFNETGDDSEEYILNVMNDICFKEDNWCAKYFKPWCRE